MCTKAILPQTIENAQEAICKLFTRAFNLYQDGYRAEEIIGDWYRISAPNGKQYEVDTRDWTCTCYSFERGAYRDTHDRLTCKHLVGARKLVTDQQRMEALETAINRVNYVEGRTDTLVEVTR